MTLPKPLNPSRRLIIHEKAYEALTKELVKAYPFEACGLLLGSEEYYFTDEVRPLTNHARQCEAHDFFQIDPLELFHLEQEVEQEGKTIIGFYHSHPDAPAIASEEDVQFFLYGLVTVIIPVIQKNPGAARGYLKSYPGEEINEIQVIVKENTR